MKLKNKRVLVIGGTSGIGAGIVKLFHEEGGRVIFCGRSENKAEELLSSISDGKNTPTFIQCDIQSQQELSSLFNRVEAEFGEIDIAVNNAGISGNRAKFDEMALEDFFNVMEVNFNSMVRCLHYEIKSMLKSEGVILNVSSTSGLIGNGLGFSHYAASKHAIVGLTKSLALEYAAQNIRINALCPGFVDTEMTRSIMDSDKRLQKRIPLLQPLGRLGTVEEIAKAALFLCSDDSTFMTGASLVADGGLTV